MIRSLFVLLFLLASCRIDPNHAQSQLTGAELPAPPIHATAPVDISNRYFTGVNYLKVQQARLIQPKRLSFDLSWDASWRRGAEYDAAWVFVKVKQKGQAWRHATLQPNTTLVTAKEGGDQAMAEVAISPDRVGMMIYRQNDGYGNNRWTIEVALAEPYDPATTEVRVFGIAMVHVPMGSFELGTLRAERDRSKALTPGAGGAPYNPFFTFSQSGKNNYGGIYRVASEAPIEIGKQEGQLFWLDADIRGANTFSGVPTGTLASSFPKGYAGFYQMRYELSQREYCDFLNTLTPEQQKARDITGVAEFDRPIADYRNAITLTNGTYTTNRPHRPCNFISWLDGQAYADWAGLRHMTEMEFEKSCRGPEPAVYREYVWGVNEIKESKNMRFCSTFYQGDTIATAERGQETIDGNIHASMFSYRNFIDVCTPQGNFYDPSSDGCRGFTGGDGGRGPVRKGIFAVTADGDRVKAGATYYGAMDMGGNLQEPVVTVGHPSGRKFAGTHGNGVLTPDGYGDNPDWQPISGEYAFGGRGGCWKFHENHARTADRFKGLRTKPNRRASHIGFRGVRTAWK